MAKEHVHQALFLTVIASLCFSFPALLIKLLMNDVTPLGALSVRFFIAAVGFPLIVLVISKKDFKKIFYPKDGELHKYAMLAGVLTLNMALGFSAFHYIPANKAILIFLMYPIADTLLAYIFLKEPITRTDTGAIILTMIGAYFIIGLNGETATATNAMLGYGLGIAGMLLFASYLVMSRAIGKKYNYYKRTAWLFIFGFFSLTIMFFFTGDPSQLFMLSTKSWLLLLALGVVTTLIPYTILSYTTAKIKASIVSIIIVLGPIVGIGLVTWVFNEPFTTNMWIGSGCVLAAFLLSTIAEWKEEEKHWKHAHH